MSILHWLFIQSDQWQLNIMATQERLKCLRERALCRCDSSESASKSKQKQDVW